MYNTYIVRILRVWKYIYNIILFSQELPVRINANGHVYGQVDLEDDSDKSNSNYHRPYGIARKPSVLLSPDYTGECERPDFIILCHFVEHITCSLLYHIINNNFIVIILCLIMNEKKNYLQTLRRKRKCVGWYY